MLLVIIINVLFLICLFTYTYYEDWRDSLWFYGTAIGGKKDPDNIFWHKIKPHEAISGWLTGVFGGLWFYFNWKLLLKYCDILSAVIFFFINLTVFWGVRVKLHIWFLRRFKNKIIDKNMKNLTV